MTQTKVKQADEIEKYFERTNDVSCFVMAQVQANFEEWNNAPGAKFLVGLRQIAQAIHAMAYPDREAVNKAFASQNASFSFSDTMYLSYLPCGIGKTTTLIETIKALMLDPFYDETGFIVFLSKLSEIETITTRIGLVESDYSIIVSKDRELDKKGNANKKQARVLFTTQQMLGRLSSGERGRKNFSDVADYYFNGKPRQVRVWDEACLPANILVIERDKLSPTVADLRRINPELADRVDRFCNVELYGKKDGDRIEIPDFSAYGVTVQEALGNIKYEEFRESIQTLFSCQGLTARIRTNGGVTTIQYEDALPADIAPMLILDASGRGRKTYEYWLEDRGGLRPLQSPSKSYKGLTVHHWNRGGGKTAQSKRDTKYKEIAVGVAREIDRIRFDKDVLVVTHKESFFQPDMAKEIIANVTTDRDRVHFTTWGKHTASNEWKECEHVILVGLQYYTPAQYEATALGAKGKGIGEPASKEVINETMVGELGYHIEQAAGRGKTRLTIGDGCPMGCHLYLIYSLQPKAGVTGEDLMHNIFPDSSYKNWEPLVSRPTKTKGKIVTAIEEHEGDFISYKALRNKCKLDRPAYLRANLEDGEVEKYLRLEAKTLIKYAERNGEEGLAIDRKALDIWPQQALGLSKKHIIKTE